MTQQAQAETSGSAPPAVKPSKGNQLEGKKSVSLTAKQAADIFHGSILGDNAKSDKSAEDGTAPAKDTKPKQPKKSHKEQLEADEVDDTEAGETEGQSSDEEETEGQSEADGEGDESADLADEADDSEASDEELHSVTVDGKPMQITYQELVDGYIRQATFTKKTTELASERKALDAQREEVSDLTKVKEAYQTETGRFNERAHLVLVAFEKGFLPQPPAEELRDKDPAQYLLQKEKHQEALQFMGGLRHEMAKVQEQNKAEHQKAVKEGRTKLLSVQPELMKPEVRGKLQSYVLGLGYTEDQIKTEADHRLFDLAFKAMKWDDMIARQKAPSPEKKRPKVLSNTKARDDRDTVLQKKKSETLNRHKRDHSVRSASDVIKERILASRKR